MPSSTLFRDFPGSFTGAVLRPGDDQYAAARAIFNTHTSHATPALIARAADENDVVTVARYAADTGTALAVRAGGHGADGAAMPNDALVVDLSQLKTISVDPDSSVVRLGAGVLLKEMDAALADYGLVVPSGTVSTTGIAGLTLGGGIGYHTRKYGATVDNLRSCTIVTTDGRQLRASETENPDLFWAVRGGGGNFGIVTELEFLARPLSPYIAAGVMPFPLQQAPEVLAGLRAHMPSAPRDLAVLAILTRCPPLPPIPPEFHDIDVLMPFIVYTGPAEQAERVIGNLASLGRPIVSTVGPMPWTQANRMLDAIAPPGRRYYNKGGYLRELSDEVIAAMVARTAAAPPAAAPAFPSTAQSLWALGGAITEDFEENTVAFSREAANWFLESATEWDDPADDAIYHNWLDGTLAEMKPHLLSNGYVNLSSDQGPAWRRGVWGSPAKYARLVEAKTTWDPHNLLRYNKNIPPKKSARTPPDVR
jgi:FAD/FMN-containing dehydrogenase